MNNWAQIRGKEVVVQPQQILNRILSILGSATYVKDEHVPRPPSLFDDISLGRPSKATLASLMLSLFPPGPDDVPQDPNMSMKEVTFFTMLYVGTYAKIWGMSSITLEWLQLWFLKVMLAPLHKVRGAEETTNKVHICLHWRNWSYQSYCVPDWFSWESTQQERTQTDCQ